MAYPVPNHQYFKLHLPDLQQVDHIEVKPFDEHWWNAYVKMIPKSVKRLKAVWIKNLLVKHADISVRKANITDLHNKELQKLVLRTYGNIVVNFCHVQEYRDLLDIEYHPPHCIDKLINELLNDKDGKCITEDQLVKIKYNANEARTKCASLFCTYYDEHYNEPPSGIQDIDEYNCEFISNFNAYYKTQTEKVQVKEVDTKIKNEIEYKYQTTSSFLPIIMWFGSFQTEGEWLYTPKKSSIEITNPSGQVSAAKSNNGRAKVLNEKNLQDHDDSTKVRSFSKGSSIVSSSASDKKNVRDAGLECSNTLKLLLHHLTAAAHDENKVAATKMKTQFFTQQTQLAQLLEIGIRAPGTTPQDVQVFQEQLTKSIHRAIQLSNDDTCDTVNVNTAVVSGLQNKRKRRTPELIAATPEINNNVGSVPADIVDISHDDLQLVDCDDGSSNEEFYRHSSVEDMEEMAYIDEDYIKKKFPQDNAENIKLHNQALDFYHRTSICASFRTVSTKFGSLEEKGIYKIKAPLSYENSQEEYTDVGNDCSIPLNGAIVYVTNKCDIGKRTSTFYEVIISNTVEYYFLQLTHDKYKDYVFNELHEEETDSGSVNNDSQKGKKKKAKN